MALASLTTPLIPNLTPRDLDTLDQVAIGRCQLRKNLPPRLRKAGYHSLGDVARVTAGKLMRVRKIGPGTIVVLQERIQSTLNRPILASRSVNAMAAMPEGLKRERDRILTNLSTVERHRLAATPITRLKLDVRVTRAIEPLRCLMAIELADLTVTRIMDLSRATTDVPQQIRNALLTELKRLSSEGPAPGSVDTGSTTPKIALSARTPAIPTRNPIPDSVKLRIETIAIATLPGLTVTARQQLRGECLHTLAHVAQRSLASLSGLVEGQAITLLMNHITAHYRDAVARHAHVKITPGLYTGFSEWVRPDTVTVPDIEESKPILDLGKHDRDLLATYPWNIESLGLPKNLKFILRSESRTLADLADETAADLMQVPGFDQDAVNRTIALLEHILSTRLPYTPRIAPHPMVGAANDGRIGFATAARRDESLAGPSTTVPPFPVASRGLANGNTNPAGPFPGRKTPLLDLAPEEAAILATYPTRQTGTGIDALLHKLHSQGELTLAQVAKRNAVDLSFIRMSSASKVSRLKAYLQDLIARETPYVEPVVTRALPNRLRHRLMAIPIESLVMPEDLRADLSSLGFTTLAQLVRRPLADIEKLHVETGWIEGVRVIVAVVCALCDLGPSGPLRLDSRADSGIIAWMSPNVPHVRAHELIPREGNLPVDVKPYLERHLLADCEFAGHMAPTLRRHRIMTLAQVAQVPKLYIAHLVGEADATVLSGLISAYWAWIIRKSPAGARSTKINTVFMKWILPKTATLPRLPLRGPLIVLTDEQRAILKTYSHSVAIDSQRIDVRPLIKSGIKTLADLADQDLIDILATTGFSESRIARISGIIRQILSDGRPYRKPIPQHPMPVAMIRELSKTPLSVFAIPDEAKAWLNDNGCDSLVSVTRIPVGMFLHLPQAAKWIGEIRKEVSSVRWSLAQDPFDPERADAHLYYSFLGWIDPTVEKPVPVPVPLMTITEPDTRQLLERRQITDLLVIGETTKRQIELAGFTTLLSLVDADIAILMRIRGMGPTRITKLYQALEETVASIKTETRSLYSRTVDDSEWDAAAPHKA